MFQRISLKDNEGEIQALTDKNINRLVQIEKDKEKEIIEVLILTILTSRI